MLTFKQFLAEIQASNDNQPEPTLDQLKIKSKHHSDEARRFGKLLDKTPENSPFYTTHYKNMRHHEGEASKLNFEIRKQEILASRKDKSKNQFQESKTIRAMIAATMLAASPAQAGGLAHELPVYSYSEINKPGLNPQLVAKSKEALEQAQDEYDESMPGEHLSNAIDAHNNGDINAAFEHLKQHKKMIINTKQSSPMS